MITEDFVRAFTQAAFSPDPDLATAALSIARLEYPTLDAGPYLARLDALGQETARRVAAAPDSSVETPEGVDPQAYAQVTILNDLLFRELGFLGNDRQYEDPRNSFLNEVLDRRTGIPITLAVVYLEVARRAGLPRVDGINFPGHFLVRCRGRAPYTRDLIIDAFHGGALLSEDACRTLLQRHADDKVSWEAALGGHATKPQILARMLLNLKRLYVKMHSYPQARDAQQLLMAVDPSAINELRDRGLLAYHLNDFASALRDLQAWLQLCSRADPTEESRDDQAEVWEHIKVLRRRIASLN